MSTATATTCHAALIPAKRHSSRCPDKNWRAFSGDGSLTDLVLSGVPSDLFAQVILSTDRPEYEPPVACEVHRRDATLATVEADVQDVVRQVIEQYGLHDSYVWLLNPTSPFRAREDFERIAELIDRTGCPAVVSVTPVGPYVWQGDRPMFTTSGRRTNTQDAVDRYFVENGMFYVFRAADFMERGTWYLPGVRRYVQQGLASSIDIDTPEDFREAQALWRSRRGRDEEAAPPALSPAVETIRNETLAVEELIAPPVAPHLTLLAGHVGRYALAAEALGIHGAHTVLDASCGQGYGSYLLARQAGRVVGLDVNPQYLEVADRCFTADNLTFQTYQAYFDGPHDPVDKLVCIETYEHLPVEEVRAFWHRLLGALAPGGDAFVTCPLGDDGPSAANPHHLNEPRIETLHRHLAGRFANATYRIAQRTDSYGQTGEYVCATLSGYSGDAAI